MDDLQKQYLKCLLDFDVLRFGEFQTKSGRLSPYFFNTGNLCTASSLKLTAQTYATALRKHFFNRFTNLYGPAYKGIPLAVATAQAYFTASDRDISVTFNRKEVKDHGERGSLIGRSYQNSSEKVVIVEDVLTAGTSLRESLAMLCTMPVEVVGCLVGINRQEIGVSGNVTAALEIEQQFHVPVKHIINLDDIIAELWNRSFAGKVWIDDQQKAKIDTYRAQYCG